VIYRPHPRSGVVDRAYGQANREIQDMIAAANQRDPGARHIFDQGAELGWQLSAADVAIVDISAMVYDRLASGKPLLITRPVAPQAEIDAGGYLSACEWLNAADAAQIVSRIETVRADPASAERLAYWVERYFGDTTPGATTERFHAAIQRLMDRWDEHAALHTGDGQLGASTGARTGSNARADDGDSDD
jgi:hypothetical protein